MWKKIYKKYIPEKRRLKNRLLYLKVTSIFYRGDRFECNVCKKKFRKLRPLGKLKLRINAECPYCGAQERSRVLFFYLQNETTIFEKKSSLLHFAPEWGLHKIFKKTKNLQYINVDLNSNFADMQMDITDLKFPKNTFDFIICSHVLGHVPDENKAIKEMKRVLKPHGTAFILTIVDWNNPVTYESESIKTPEERLKHYSEPDLLRLHGADFSKRLEKGGFNVEIINYIEKLGKEKQEYYRLGDGNRETIFKCTKS